MFPCISVCKVSGPDVWRMLEGHTHHEGGDLAGGPDVGHKVEASALALLQEICDLRRRVQQA